MHTSRCEREDSARRVHRLPRPGKNDRHTQISGARQQARGRSQQCDAYSSETKLSVWRIRPVQLSLQLLGTDRAEQGYARDREKDGQGSLVTLQRNLRQA